MLTRVAAVLASLLVAPAIALAVAVPAQAADEPECSQADEENPPGAVTRAGKPLGLLHIDQAQALFDAKGTEAGRNVTVAVVDSGVVDTGPLDVEHAPSQAGQGEVADFHGTAVAGLIAGGEGPRGVIGIAPAAKILDVRVYDTDEPAEGQEGVESANVVAGLRWVAKAAKTDPTIKVVNVSLALGHVDALEKAIHQLVKRDIVVVAASGNRPQGETDYGFSDYDTEPTDGDGEDAADDFFPAGYDDVVAVNATAGGLPNSDEVDVRGFVLQNSQTDVAAPTYDAVSVDINGGTCRLADGIATSWAAAEVSGVVAMLRSWYPQDSAKQIIARLKATANGTDADPEMTSWLTGAGVVQPLEALTRPMTVTRSGTVVAAVDEASQLPPARAPRPESDPLGSMRDNAVWWGLLSGGAIVLALLMRPIMDRLRR